jgi:SNF2 family DNA or RNA helicase
MNETSVFHCHLLENKKNLKKPFTFFITYQNISEEKEQPLKTLALSYLSQNKIHEFIKTFAPLYNLAQHSHFIQSLTSSGEIWDRYFPSLEETYLYLEELPLIEAAGIKTHLPENRAAYVPELQITIGNHSRKDLGLQSLLDFNVRIMLGDKVLSSEDIKKLLGSTQKWVRLKNQWVKINKTELEKTLAAEKAFSLRHTKGLSFTESLQLLSAEEDKLAYQKAKVIMGPFLKETLTQLRHPDRFLSTTHDTIFEQHLKTVLRPYQKIGVEWLFLLYQLRLSGCLADDMGLGKTLQTLAFLLLQKYQTPSHAPNLLILPPALLQNWENEIKCFTPTLSYRMIHHSMADRSQFATLTAKDFDQTDLVITTYSLIHKLEWLQAIEWETIIADEAQLIKNPSTKQSKALKKLSARSRFCLTGTPIENKLTDIWSLFDFLNPGLLGSRQAFSKYEKKHGHSLEEKNQFVSRIRLLTAPYILRRAKTDKNILPDLPDKTEIQTYCTLTHQQIQLYESSIQDLKKALHIQHGIQRKGLILSYLTRFKQICNHPSQWQGVSEYPIDASGKFLRLAEICEEIAALHEKVLVFTQFTEIIPAIVKLLASVFGQKGLHLDGKVPLKKRADIIDAFQSIDGPPFLVLSLKTGGTGLNLTAATHVIHFDRWWNPAVENQATDRAYRIGQHHPVIVHKFICKGTIEEKIDALLMSKTHLSLQLLSEGNELNLTEMDDERLLKLISLDIHQVLIDGEEETA